MPIIYFYFFSLKFNNLHSVTGFVEMTWVSAPVKNIITNKDNSNVIYNKHQDIFSVINIIKTMLSECTNTASAKRSK